MKVSIPSALRSYTEAARAEADVAALAAVLADLAQTLAPTDELFIVLALSGGWRGRHMTADLVTCWA